MYKPLVITGVSGVGKGALIDFLKSALPNKFGHIVSHTTRMRREEEIDGFDYHFVSEEEFKKMLDRDEFIHYTKKDNNALYGTSKWKIKTT